MIDTAVPSRTEAALESVAHTLASRTADVEDLVRNAWSKTMHPVSGIALAATGGFGRGELFPHSDVDLLIVVESENQIAPIRDPLSAFLQKTVGRGAAAEPRYPDGELLRIRARR